MSSAGPAVVASRETTERPASATSVIPLIAIGASDGGLGALGQFFAPVPADCGAAFVVIQHLDPSQPGMLVELLQRCTALTVVQVTDGMRVAANHVFVIPPGSDLHVFHDVLHLMEPTQSHGWRLPIDLFFRSLADDRGPDSIAVVLSGMGSDGTLGLRAVKEHAGAAFVQSPDSAKFDSMPRSAIEHELADVIASPDELFAHILEYRKHIPAATTRGEPSLSASDRMALDKVVLLLRGQTGHDFSQYKLSTLSRRIQRRTALHHLTGVHDYVRFVRENPSEGELLFQELLIGVTRFFRDAEVWDYLRSELLPAMLTAKADGETVRAWVTACSTGEEAYSLAIAFHEAREATSAARPRDVQIFATDLDPDAITRARGGVYPLNISADVPPALLARYFVKEERGYRVVNEVRDMVIFARQNIVMDPPFTKLDLITCRNLLIYMTAELQRKVIPLLHYSLHPDGVLLLGSAETIGNATDLFASISDKARLYRRTETANGVAALPIPAVFGHPSEVSTALTANAPGAESVQSSTDRLLLARFTPSAVLVGEQGDILYVSGKTGRYLEPAAGKANLNVFAMAGPELAAQLNESFWRALRTRQSIELPPVSIGEGVTATRVRVTVAPITDAATERQTALIVFHDLPAQPATARRRLAVPTASGRESHAELLRDLEQARVALLTAREEMQLSQEKLRATNEELQSTNEELQSTNEELTTSKEEMQSMNEELLTVNQELQTKLDELALASTDMANLLNSTNIATLFLDKSMKVRRFTTPMKDIIHLRTGDVGRPVSDSVSSLDFPDMVECARGVVQSLETIERDVRSTTGRWFAVRILPYRSFDDGIDGVVITCSDITEAKTLEADLRLAQVSLEEQLAHRTLSDPVLSAVGTGA